MGKKPRRKTVWIPANYRGNDESLFASRLSPLAPRRSDSARRERALSVATLLLLLLELKLLLLPLPVEMIELLLALLRLALLQRLDARVLRRRRNAGGRLLMLQFDLLLRVELLLL